MSTSAEVKSPAGTEGPPFSAEEFLERELRVRALIAEREFEGLIVTAPENLYYLTGYTTPAYYSPQALVVARNAEPFLVVYRSEIENVRLGSRIQDVATYGPSDDPIGLLAEELRVRGLNDARLGIETDAWFFTRDLHERLSAELEHGGLPACNGIVEACRAVKTDAEILYVRQAAELASEAMGAVECELRPGVAEDALAAMIYATTLTAGGGFPASPPYVSSGHRVCRGHATWTPRTVERGDQVYVELSGCVARYSAALMRTFVVGHECDPRLEALEEAVVAGLNAAIAALRPGAVSSDVDRACREILASQGFEYPHETGYSLGVAYPPGWNETHVFNLKPGDSRRVQANMVLHLVPHVIIPKVGTVGLSETVLVGEHSTETLTEFPRAMIRA